jgi:hypothetical protein
VTDETGDLGWLVVSVSTAGAAGTLRVQVWRKLRSLGALYFDAPAGASARAAVEEAAFSAAAPGGREQARLRVVDPS